MFYFKAYFQVKLVTDFELILCDFLAVIWFEFLDRNNAKILFRLMTHFC